MRSISAQLAAAGIEVVLTRENDTFVPLWSRTQIANNSGADLFVSIHANASITRRLKGFEVYYLSEALDDDARAVAAAENYTVRIKEGAILSHTYVLDTILWDLELTENRREAIELAKSILGEVDSSAERLKCARFYVLKGAMMPAVLVEVGYITNLIDSNHLNEKEYRDRIAGQITQGIFNYKKKFESTNGFSS